MVQRVLIATDGSGNADRAVAFGADLAAKFGADVVLVHVLLRGELSESMRRMAETEHIVEAGGARLADAIASGQGPFPTQFVLPSNPGSVHRVLHAIAEQILDRAEETARERDVKTVARHVEDGDPVSRILEITQEEGADVVVTGARGLSTFRALLLGSVSQKLGHHAKVTTVTVR
jgi:nucleotide-binding universal stress UspA family protein